MEMMTTLLAYAVALGVLVVLHELGHFAVARANGVKVLRFSVGFGRPLWKREFGRDRTEWVLAAIPLGGFVKMLDERETEGAPIPEADLPRAFNRQALWRRTLIVLAGPVANLVFAVLAYTVIGMVATAEVRPILGSAAAGTPAASAGVKNGDLVVSLGGSPVHSWGDMSLLLIKEGLDKKDLVMTVKGEDGVVRELTLDFSQIPSREVGEAWFAATGLGFHEVDPVVGEVTPGTPAARSGLQPGDLLVSIDGHPVRVGAEVSSLVRASQGRPMAVVIERGGQRREISLAAEPMPDPKGGESHYRIGIAFPRDTGAIAEVHLGPVEAFTRAFARTRDTAELTLRIFGRMIVGRSSWSNISGPVRIAGIAGESARMGYIAYLEFLAFVSISLGVLNLLPVPVLDGGHLLYYAVEFATGHPPSVRLLDIGQRVGIALIIGLTVLALYNDFTGVVIAYLTRLLS